MDSDPTDLPTAALDELDDEFTEDDLPTAEMNEEDLGPPEPGIPDKLYFRIGEVASIVGVDSHVLRYWESEFKMKPHRSGSGQRLYRKTDLSRFLRIRRLLHDEGYTIAGARKIMSGQAQPAAAGAPVETGRIKEILARLESLRRQIRAIRDEFESRGFDGARRG